MPTPIPSPVPTAAPTCTISLSPATNNLTLGGANGTIDATVNCTAAVNQVTFTVSPAGIASVTSPGTVVTPNTTYRTTVTPVSVGGTVVTGHVFSGGVERASATAIVNVTALAGWFQVRDADVHSGGSLTTRVLAPNVFGLPGTGGFPGVPAYTSGTDLTPARASLTYGWLVQNTASPSLRKFDYDSLANQIPDTTTINSITLNSIGGATLASGGTLDAATGYYWYKYDGTSTGNLTLTSAADLLSRKVVLLVDNANFIINAPINVTDGQGFFMVLVKGNITVGSGVGGAAPQAGPNLEGIYEADNAFSDSAGNTQLRLRGSLVAHGLTGGVVSLLRDLGAGNVANPAELFEFAPDQILLYPPTLGVRKLNWKEVAP